MSSTNRGWVRSVSDYYCTPQQPICDFIKKFIELEPQIMEWVSIRQDLKILDPCAWWDDTHDMAYPAVLFEYWANHNNINTIDIREDSGALYKADFLLDNRERCKWYYDLVISNPPFSHAQQFIEKSLEYCKEWWFVVMLLRLNYFGSLQRKKFRENNMPKYAFVHHKRISFTDWRWFDSIEYMHCVWQKWYITDNTKLFII